MLEPSYFLSGNGSHTTGTTVFNLGLILHSREYSAVLGDTFYCHIGQRGIPTGMWWVKSMDAAKHPAMQRTAPQSKEFFGCKGQYSKVEAP